MRPPAPARLLCSAVLFGLCAASACSSQESRSGPGLPCSTSPDDNPHFTCDPSEDLICINTTADKRYACRAPCDVSQGTGPGGCQPGEVCCPGTIYGDARGATRGCTPSTMCDILSDAGAPDQASPPGDGGGS